jgi:hypothetical protein
MSRHAVPCLSLLALLRLELSAGRRILGIQAFLESGIHFPQDPVPADDDILVDRILDASG